MEKEKKEKILKIILIVILLILVIVETICLFPLIQKLTTFEGQQEFKDIMKTSRTLGFMMLLGLEMIQIIIPILPGEPIEVLAGICYGEFYGTIFLLVASFITTLIIYYFVKKIGKKFIYEFISKERIDKIENSKLFNDEKKIELIMAILFLFPASPKDLLVYIGGLLPIKASRFLAIATLLRIPSIISSTIAGKYIIDGNWKISVLAYAICYAITIVVLLIINRFDKNKSMENVMKSIKDKEI